VDGRGLNYMAKEFLPFLEGMDFTLVFAYLVEDMGIDLEIRSVARECLVLLPTHSFGIDLRNGYLGDPL
jgi:hypothetical protein